MSLLYPALSAPLVDHHIWNIGLAKTPNDERNFLRGIHDPASLSMLMSYLASQQPGMAMRLTSTWVDKHPQAHPLSGVPNCEVGDLLVHWRLIDAKGNVRRRVGWLLQAKMADDPGLMTHRDASSLKEYALYENSANWHFEVKHFGHKLGTFALASDTDLAPTIASPADVQHWSYLQIRKPKASPAWSTPLQARWDSGAANWLQSFAEGIVSMMAASPGKGAVLDTINPQWTALCDALETFAAGRDSTLAGGLWQRSCMAMAGSSTTTAPFVQDLVAQGLDELPKVGRASMRADSRFQPFVSAGEGPVSPDRVSMESDEGGGFGVVRVDSIGPEEVGPD
ncbi:MAG: hypothetical protein HOQ32_01130 [Lysobacter sp.]|nr:hypothetical protein [Lysobacter sp.]